MHSQLCSDFFLKIVWTFNMNITCLSLTLFRKIISIRCTCFVINKKKLFVPRELRAFDLIFNMYVQQGAQTANNFKQTINKILRSVQQYLLSNNCNIKEWHRNIVYRTYETIVNKYHQCLPRTVSDEAKGVWWELKANARWK